MTSIRPRSAAALILALAAVPAGVAAQECGLMPGAGLAAVAGWASYEQLTDVAGRLYGVDASLTLSPVSVQAGYRRADLDGADADIGRLAATLPVPARVLPLPLGPLTVCGSGHVGAARLPAGSDAMTVFAGGIGIRLAGTIHAGGARAVPYGEVRGLVGRSTGSLFETPVGTTGLALGVEGGLRATLGHITLNVAASLDGFDDGLGITPYPNGAVEVGLGIRF